MIGRRKTVIFAATLALAGCGAAAGSDYPRVTRQHRRSDAEIQVSVLRGIVVNPEVLAANLDVQVKNGVVELAGTVRSRKARRAAEAVAETVPGVRDVRNRIAVDRP